MNASAERILGDGLTVARRRLLAGAADRQQALDRLLAAAFANHPDRGLDPIALPRPSGKKPLVLQAIPLQSRRCLDDLHPGFGPRGALVLVVDPESRAAPPHDGLHLLGLTAAESRLAALVGSGIRRRDAAAILDISEWTARDSLKNIYSKLDICSVGELVRIVDRIAAVEPPSG
jgi:DNA-binding CsgD family transcriptional regulator